MPANLPAAMAAATEHSHYLSRLYHADPALAAYVTAEAHRRFSREHMTQGFARLPSDTSTSNTSVTGPVSALIATASGA